MAETKVYNGFIYEQQPDGSWRKTAPAQQAAPQVPTVTPLNLPPPPPPPPAPPPPRTPAGAATEGAPKGFAWIDPNNPSAGVYPIGGLPDEAREGARPQQEPLSAKARVDAEQAIIDAQALYDLAQQLKVKFNQGPGATKGVYGLGDFFPTASNKTFNNLSQQARGLVKRAMGFTGGEGNTVAESSSLYDPFLPSASDLDSEILDKIAALEELAKRSATMSSSLLGKPLPEFAGGQLGNTPNALTALRMGGGPETAPVPVGDAGTQTITDPREVPPEMVREMDALVARMVSENNGRLDPQRYAQEADAIQAKYGFKPSDPVEWANTVNQYLDRGGTTLPSGVLPKERMMTRAETAKNNLVNNPLGGLLVGISNGLSAGSLDAIAPDQMAALRDTQGLPLILGEIGGGAGVVGATGRLGRAVAGRFAPSLLGGGTAGGIARTTGLDAVYGGIYGQNAYDDPLTGAVISAGGSLLGQGAGRAIGAAVGGMRRTPAAEALRAEGVPISVARQVGAGRVEDAIQSFPIVGDLSRARQVDSFQGLTDAALRESGAPIGAVPQAGGRDGLAELLGDPNGAQGLIPQAFDNATAGQAWSPDAAFNQSVADAYAAAQRLPPDLAVRATKALDNRLGIFRGQQQITGDQYQQAMRGLKSYRAEAKGQGFDEDYRDVLGKGMGALDDLVARQGTPEVIANLGKANTAYRSAKTLERAMNKAASGNQSGEIFLPTPLQMQQAGMQTQSRFPGPRPFADLADNAQQVLPTKLPNSGTTDRAIVAGILGAGGVGGTLGGGAGYAYGDSVTDGAQTGAIGSAGIATALAILGTRGGQKALEKVLIDRSGGAKRLGEAIRKKRGLFGATGNVIAQEIYN